MNDLLISFERELSALQQKGNLRRLPIVTHQGREVEANGRRMLNLSSNDYLGLASDGSLRQEFMETVAPDLLQFTSSSSRLLTGNTSAAEELEQRVCQLLGAQSALVFNSGYHMNMGILPAVSDARTLILADKLVHASLIDGIRLSAARCIRYRHNNYEQLASLLSAHHREYEKVIIVTESIFSMDGDEADLCLLVLLKKQYPNVMLYVDEAHAVGVRGANGMGCAEEHGCVADIDFLCGTFGKALASVGAYVVCHSVIRDYMVKRMRTLIFTTALPPVNLMWTTFILGRLPLLADKRQSLQLMSKQLREALTAKGLGCPSTSHIVPIMVGDSRQAIRKADDLQRKGFYILPVRPPTVPEGTSRLRISLTAALTEEDMNQLINSIYV